MARIVRPRYLPRVTRALEFVKRLPYWYAQTCRARLCGYRFLASTRRRCPRCGEEKVHAVKCCYLPAYFWNPSLVEGIDL